MLWRYIAASVRGTSHVEQDIECQDASVAHAIEDDVLLLVASDGAGSAKHSSYGSQLVCYTLQEEVARYVSAGGSVDRIDEDLVDRWIEVVVRRLHIQAGALGQPVRELACTLVAAILGRDSSVYLQLGDGAIVAECDGGYVPMTWPASGEYANTTFFLTDDRALENFQVRLANPVVNEVAVFSDGLQMLALQFETRTAYGPFFRPMFARLREEPAGESAALTEILREYLNSGVINRRTDDDKTLILACRGSIGSVAAGAVSDPSAKMVRDT